MKHRTNKYLLSAIVFALAANMVACDKKGRGEGYKVPDDGLGVQETLSPDDSLGSYEYDEIGQLIKPTDENSATDGKDSDNSSSSEGSSVENSSSVDSESSSTENSSEEQTSETNETSDSETTETTTDPNVGSVSSSPFDVKISNVVYPAGSDLVLSNETLTYRNSDGVLYNLTTGVSYESGAVTGVIVTDVFVNSTPAVFTQSFMNSNLEITIMYPSGESYGDGCYSITINCICTKEDGSTTTVDDLKFETERR